MPARLSEKVNSTSKVKFFVILGFDEMRQTL